MALILIIFSPTLHIELKANPASGRSFVETFETGDLSRWFISNGWTNGAHQGCTWREKNIAAGGGALELILRKDVQQPAAGLDPWKLYSCAELRTHEPLGYGTYEVRMQPAAGPGLVSAFFTYIGPQPDAPSPHDEIDFEFLGKDPTTVQLNYFGNGQGHHETMVKLPFDAFETMADYAFEWLPGGIRWFVNGRLVHEVKREEGKPFPVTPSRIYLSLWSGNGLDAWTGTFAYPDRPLTARYERVAFTRAGDPCQFPESVVCTAGAREQAK
ncbi:MAG: family 16 glycosylhydrolase [Rhodomicrobium sp.]|nr:family 16 glycosylhydrolase [Rhodomicrobium sp.]